MKKVLAGIFSFLIIILLVEIAPITQALSSHKKTITPTATTPSSSPQATPSSRLK